MTAAASPPSPRWPARSRRPRPPRGASLSSSATSTTGGARYSTSSGGARPPRAADLLGGKLPCTVTDAIASSTDSLAVYVQRAAVRRRAAWPSSRLACWAARSGALRLHNRRRGDQNECKKKHERVSSRREPGSRRLLLGYRPLARFLKRVVRSLPRTSQVSHPHLTDRSSSSGANAVDQRSRKRLALKKKSRTSTIQRGPRIVGSSRRARTARLVTPSTRRENRPRRPS